MTKPLRSKGSPRNDPARPRSDTPTIADSTYGVLFPFLLLQRVPRANPFRKRISKASRFAAITCGSAGSHSALRDGPKGRMASDAIAALASVRRAGNRFLLARIPVAAKGAELVLARRWVTPDRRELRAARLGGGRRNDALTRALRDDPHLGPFLSIPSKDNGFDIEGLAAAPGGRLFLGLRGPVIDGWACVLEMQVATHRDPRRLLRLLQVEGRPDRPDPGGADKSRTGGRTGPGDLRHGLPGRQSIARTARAAWRPRPGRWVVRGTAEARAEMTAGRGGRSRPWPHRARGHAGRAAAGGDRQLGGDGRRVIRARTSDDRRLRTRCSRRRRFHRPRG